ncbi:hypothetical protein CTN06_02485 [Pectobacterium zantedeschiae]|nr:hypothetical protein CTN06_02485 [Pectobacterium zantedeschiae]
MGLALKSRCRQRSNLLPADLSPESLTCVSSSGLLLLPPFCNSNYLGYRFVILQAACSLLYFIELLQMNVALWNTATAENLAVCSDGALLQCRNLPAD